MLKLLRCALLIITSLAVLQGCGGDAEQTSLAGRRFSGAASPNQAYEALVQTIYIGYFGRPADPDGLAFYSNALRNAATPPTVAGLLDAYAVNPTVQSILDSFADSVESRQLYRACEYCVYPWVDAVYQSLFSRAADMEGMEFWVRPLLKKQMKPAQVLLGLLAGAQGSDAQLIARKVQAAQMFSASLRQSGDSTLYASQIAAEMVRSMLHAMPSYGDQAAVQQAIDQTLQNLRDMRSGAMQEADLADRRLLLLASAERMADSGELLQELATVLQRDLNQRRPHGPHWQVQLQQAERTVPTVRAQLIGYQGAMLIGQVPVALFPTGKPYLDYYRLPECPVFQLAMESRVTNTADLRSADLRCYNGLIVSVIRGTSRASEAQELRAKLSQMIAYHRDSGAAISAQPRHFQYINAAWFGSATPFFADPSPALEQIGLYSRTQSSFLSTGSALQRRQNFIDCVASPTEICLLLAHGSTSDLLFEGPGAVGAPYSSDEQIWTGADMAAVTVQARFIEMISCGTQGFLVENSVATSLLMRGKTLLTRGMVETTYITSMYMDWLIREFYGVLALGATFAEASFGVEENSPVAMQGDPYISLRTRPDGPQPKLLIDGRHYHMGGASAPIDFPDAVGGASVVRVTRFSNGGNADLHLQIRSFIDITGLDKQDGSPVTSELGYNAQLLVRVRLVHSDGSVLLEDAVPRAPDSGNFAVTLAPSQSVVVTYALDVRTTEAGTPRAAGLYTGVTRVLSNDPDSALIYLAPRARVRIK